MIEGVRVSVECADALERSTDVLVLKYAQRSYGVDRAALDRIGAQGVNSRPRVGRHSIVHQPHGLGARTLVMVGVPPIGQFSYGDIRDFGERAVMIPATENLRARELCLTLHGVGFGLDEAEALRSEVAGVLEALRVTPGESRPEAITILENDPDRVVRLQAVLRNVWSPVSVREFIKGGSGEPSDLANSIHGALEWAGRDAAARPHAFIAMPFQPVFDDRFHYGIARPLRSLGMICERMDELNFTGDVVAMMRRRIENASVVVADLSSGNPNVYLEIGYAWACRRPTVLLCDSASEPLFDVRGQRFLRYESIRDLEDKLTTEVSGLLRLSSR